MHLSAGATRRHEKLLEGWMVLSKSLIFHQPLLTLRKLSISRGTHLSSSSFPSGITCGYEGHRHRNCEATPAKRTDSWNPYGSASLQFVSWLQKLTTSSYQVHGTGKHDSKLLSVMLSLIHFFFSTGLQSHMMHQRFMTM